MKLPNRIFFTGAPGSKWSGVAQQIETNPAFDTSDRTPERTYSHSEYGGHKGAYFGTGMEFPPVLTHFVLDAPFTGTGTRLYKSHEWAYMLEDIKKQFPESWIVMVLRGNDDCFDWWKQAGGWNITYPNYEWYKDDQTMRGKINTQNDLCIDFCLNNQLQWKKWNTLTARTEFGLDIDIPDNDILVAIYKNVD